MKLDENGRCCGSKPIYYERPSVHKFCDHCKRAFDPETGNQVENWAWKADGSGTFKRVREGEMGLFQ